MSGSGSIATTSATSGAATSARRPGAEVEKALGVRPTEARSQ
jgi:hypothetical protein